MKKFLLLGFIAILGFGCSQGGWKVDDSGLTVFPEDPSDQAVQAIRLTPFGEEIIKVSATAADAFSNEESLVALPLEKTVDFDVTEDGDILILTTAKLTAKVSQTTGEVQFFDADGNMILQEKEKGGKTIKSMEVDGVKGYEVRQVWESHDDEGLYGLGQHQAHDYNYKGKNEELFQYNTKVSVPVIVSTRNYGILWDNYSLTRWGDPRPYGQLDQFKLFNNEGEEGSLTATYIDNKETGNVFTVRQENTIDYENLTTIENFPEGFDFTNARITWEGELQPEETGIHRFLMYYAGYTKIWIDGELMADRWRTAWNPSVAKFEVDMEAGKKYHVKLDWIPDGGESYIGLKALTPVDPAEQERISFWSEMGDQIDYYFMAGNSMDDVISRYRELTGKAQVMPKWAMGFWQSRERYKTQDELLDVLHEFREREIPLDNIVQDWSYWPVDQWGSHEFDKERFPDAKGMVDEVHENNARIMISVWPKFYHNTEHFKEFDKNGWMYRQAVEDSIKDWIYPGYVGSFYDAYAPGARELFWEQIKEELYTKGFDAWWLDATEPDILSNASMEYRKDLMNPTHLGPSTQYFNAFALMNAKGIYEGQRAEKNDERVFILTRSGFAGMQRFGTVTWSGDIGTVWEDLKAQIPAAINFSLSGMPYWTMDIGGFCVEKRYERAEEGSEDMKEWRELNTRWYQFGAFSPLFRVHGQYPYRELWNIAPKGHKAYESMLYYNKLRYRLMPYIYSLTGAVYHDNYTIMRGLVMDYTDDQNVYNIDDQFMFGGGLMACPVYEYEARSREVYFPENKGWYDFYTGEFVEGGQTKEVDAPYERMPMYAPAGAIITAGPEIQYTTEKKPELITVYVYTGDDGEFELYEDENTNYNYEEGKFSTIPFTYNNDNKTLTIGSRQGSFEGMLNERQFNVVFVAPDKSVGFNPDVARGQLVDYSGQAVEVVFE
ncbi:alpha-D-xyloside xylohydrolase [Marinilabilia salmonicolor]|jgi:alpha-D-xyloside xylohydrolase|uniref:TIM-barrel domain-containing protein n=1 Tax=Marinilabilia salmonicolor TaxID=989 RepID=UPI000D084D94|nr:TIM-barrel domain-containing protein [Marinilabilia salmonicolor]PRY96227.1 alpha-D-xyloside xylohydrolase [Marinilabilia salmonicolor]